MSPTVEAQPVRGESFDCPAPAHLDLRVNLGHIDVRAADVAHVRADVSLEEGESSDDRALRALQGVRITFSEQSRRLVVRTPRELRRARLAISVEAPVRSRLVARVHSGSIAASGLLSELKAVAGRGDISADDIDGDVHVGTGAGEVRLGRVNGDVTARSGKGNLVIDRAARGRLRLTTGSGDVRVALQAGTTAELDLVSGSGSARSELDVSDQAPAGWPAVSVRARTGSGDAVVTRAAD